MRERTAGGELPAWAADLVSIWARARDAARRGDFGTASEVQVLVGAVAEQIERVSTTAQSQYREVRGAVRVLGQLFGGKRRARRRSS
jgi:hypothetical protein